MLNEAESAGCWLLIVRHGATDGPGTLSGFGRPSDDPPLTACGHAHAQALADGLVHTLPTPLRLWTSPRRRAQQTLAPLAQALAMTPHIAASLDEIAYGRWAGRRRADIAAIEGEATLAAWDARGQAPDGAGFVPDAASSHAQAQALAEQMTRGGQHALAVSHNGRVRAFSALDPALAPARQKLSCGAVGLLWRPQPATGAAGWRVVAWNVSPAQAAGCLHRPIEPY